MARPAIAFITDFGTRDHYVGAMKGVVLGICPEVSLVDITHEIRPRDLLEAAFVLERSFREFQRRTVFVVMVDSALAMPRQIGRAHV